MRIALILLLITTSGAYAQEIERFDRYPHLTIVPALSLNSGGYQPTSASLMFGARYEGRRLFFSNDFAYDNARKVNDNTDDNRNGYSRSWKILLFYRLPSHWFVGAGAGWSEVVTTNYSKHCWAPHVSGGRDLFLPGTSFRLNAMYKFPGTDHANASQGPTIEFILPSPVTGRHLYLYESFTTHIFHTTITDPSDPVLTARQKGEHSVASYLRVGLMVKF